jgi:hypothetical protein
MNFFIGTTTVLHVWAVLGPFVGAWYGSTLARHSQKNHWINDNQKEEYRELLSALFDAGNIGVLNRSLGRETTAEEDLQEERSDHRLFGIMHTRLFIREFLE